MVPRLARWPLAVAALCTIASVASAQHGRFLRNPADSTIVFSYGNAQPTAFDRGVTALDKQTGQQTFAAGTIRFDYDTYLERPDGTTSGGGALSGGFFVNTGVRVKPRYNLAWVQTVVSTRNGENDWGLPTGSSSGWFPDAAPNSPAYPNNFPATSPLDQVPTLGYQDFPNRLFANGAQNWFAELGLVAIAKDAGTDGFREVRVLGTFLWGFNLTNTPANAVTGSAPIAWGEPTATFLSTLNEFYDGTGGNNVASGRFRFAYNTNLFIPQPGVTAMLAVAAGLCAARRRRDAA